MNRFHYHLIIIFSLMLLLAGCAKNQAEEDATSIDSIEINQGLYNYKIFIDDAEVGQTRMTILNGILETFNGIQYVNCTYIKEETSINGSSGSHFFFAQKLVDGFLFLSDDISEYTTKYIPFPLTLGDQLYGPFSAISSENIFVNVTEHLPSYTNKNKHTFKNVMKATDETGLIHIYLSKEYYIVQKEDNRYAPTIQSLSLN